MSVLSLSRSTPPSSNKKADLTVTLDLANTTDQLLSSVTILGIRGVPIQTQDALDAALAHPAVPDPTLSQAITPKSHKPVVTSLAPRGNAIVEFTTDTDVPTDAGICICHNAIYPLYFAAHTTDVSGADVLVGSTQTYVPSFSRPDQIRPVQVSWVWPVLDRPHRLVDEQPAGQPPVFVDDELATSVTSGRLSRILAVLTAVAGRVPMTVVMDPELIDELAVMSAGDYRVQQGSKTVAGVGTAAAKAWLAGLAAAIAQPGIEVSYTPYADPDIESLTRNGLPWTQSLGPAAQARVSTALGNPAHVANISWPPRETLSADTLATVVRQGGVSSVILDDAVLPSSQQAPVPNALTQLQTSAGPITAVVTSTHIQRWVPSVLSIGGAGLAELPQLVSEVALRAVVNGSLGSYAAIVPPRTLDPSPDVAARAILDTAAAFWSSGITVGAAQSSVTPSERGPLLPPRSDIAGLSPSIVSAAQRLTEVIPALDTMLAANDAARLLGPLPAAVQRAESAEWTLDRSAGDAFAASLTARIDQLESGVRIVRPTDGTYTLASNNSPLPVTVENDLAVTVTVQVRVVSANGLPGFSARPIAGERIPPNTKVTLHIPTHVERTGRFQVQAELLTPSGDLVGSSVPLTVHSTALGLVGVVITVVAGGVLALALVVRFVRRYRGRNRSGPAGPGGPPVSDAQPQPVPA
jgi:hypothetical protein